MEREGRNRVWAGLGLAAVLGALFLLIAGGLRENVVYFLTPSELEARGPQMYDRPLRLGGRVEPGSVEWDAESRDLRFVLTDEESRVPVRGTGAPPAMFREGLGVVVEGRYLPGGVFESDNLMVKHSNEYRPPDGGEHPRQAYESLIAPNPE